MSDAAIEALCEVALKILNIDFSPFYEMMIRLLEKIDLNDIIKLVTGFIGS